MKKKVPFPFIIEWISVLLFLQSDWIWLISFVINVDNRCAAVIASDSGLQVVDNVAIKAFGNSPEWKLSEFWFFVSTWDIEMSEICEACQIRNGEKGKSTVKTAQFFLLLRASVVEVSYSCKHLKTCKFDLFSCILCKLTLSVTVNYLNRTLGSCHYPVSACNHFLHFKLLQVSVVVWCFSACFFSRV